MKLLLVGGLLGLITAVALSIAYFALGKFFAASARALNRNQRRDLQVLQSLRVNETAPDKTKYGAVAKAGH